MKGLLISTKTSVWLLCLLAGLLLAGALIMPGNRAFQSIHSMPLLAWAERQSFKATWWLWGSLVVLFCLSVNTLFCSADSLLKKGGPGRWLALMPAQLIHAGFLFMLLAHLLSSLGGFRGYEVAAEGGRVMMPDGSELEIGEIHISQGPDGYITDWRVDVCRSLAGKDVGCDTLGPNRPLFRKGSGVYVRDLRVFPRKMVLLEISREPGALWALIGAILFLTGTLALLRLKMKRETRE